MVEEIKLDWQGPYKYSDFEDKEKLPANDAGGLYLWVRNNNDTYKLHYVGQSAHIRQRFFQHFMWLLGGGYMLYDPSDLSSDAECEELGKEFKPDDAKESFFTEYLVDLPNSQKLARENLESLSFFWAEITDENSEVSDLKFARESSESALIVNGGKGTKIENSRVSRSPDNSPIIEVISKFRNNVKIEGIAKVTQYGTGLNL